MFKDEYNVRMKKKQAWYTYLIVKIELLMFLWSNTCLPHMLFFGYNVVCKAYY